MKGVAEYLQAAAQALKKQHPGMSVRAVAARLKVSPSYWSKILRGERAMSQRLLPRVVKVFGMDVQQVAELQRLILREIEDLQLVPATGLRTSPEKASPVAVYRNLGPSDFWLLEEWFHIPILNAVTLGGNPSITQVARRLHLVLTLAKASSERLIAAGFLRDQQGTLERTDLQVRFPTQRSHPQVRRYHAAMIKKAHEEITRQGTSEAFDTRLISSVCFAGTKEKIQEAKLIMEEAMYRAANLMAESSDCEEVFQLNIQFFPLTK